MSTEGSGNGTTLARSADNETAALMLRKHNLTLVARKADGAAVPLPAPGVTYSPRHVSRARAKRACGLRKKVPIRLRWTVSQAPRASSQWGSSPCWSSQGRIALGGRRARSRSP